MFDVSVSGQRDLRRLAERLHQAGSPVGIRREVTKALNKATEPAKDAVAQSALDILPHSGGLAELVASARISTRTTLRGSNPSVRLTGRLSGHDLRAIDRGRLRHPVFGNRGAWVTQNVPPGFWTKPLERNARRTRLEVVFAMRAVARMVTRG